MYAVVYCSLFFVLPVYGFSFEEALRIADCLAPCWNETCSDSCNYENATFLPATFPQLSNNADANIGLHCTGMYAMMISYNPGIYIIESSTSEDAWNNARVGVGTLSTFSNLTAGTLYRYRFYKLTKYGITQPEVSNWFATFEENYRPQKIENIFVTKIDVDSKNMCQLWAKVHFEPAEDRSCTYNVVFWTGEHNLLNYAINEFKAPGFSFNLKYLDYNQTNDVSISSTNEHGSQTSNQTTFTFDTPSCLEFHNDLNICAPESVEGLRIRDVHKHELGYDIIINWDKPIHEPDNYTIEIASSGEYRELNISGNATEISITNIELGSEYIEVHIFAQSVGGRSPESIIIEKTDNLTGPDFPYNKNAIIIFSLVILAVVTTIGIIYIRIKCIKYKKKYNNMRYAHFESFSQDIIAKKVKESSKKNYSTESSYALISRDKFELSPEKLKLKNVLGSGAYGIVKLGLLQNDHGGVTEVAVKMLRDNPTVEDINNFNQEIRMMKSAGRHLNIVSLIGYCNLYNKPILVVEYCCKGDLQTYLRTIWGNNVILGHRACLKLREGIAHKCSSISGTNEIHHENSRMFANRLYDIQQDVIQSVEVVSAADLLNFARQVATGMEFLSSSRIVHRDLAARNILLCADKIVKISDFGLSRDIYQENVYRKQGNGKLPLKWMAIESLTHQVYTTYSDVWSFGILLWEIVTLGGIPYPLIPTNTILNVLKSGYRMERPANCGSELYNIMYSCWNARPQSRPTFTELKQNIDNLLCNYSENEYLNLNDIVQDLGDEHDLLAEN